MAHPMLQQQHPSIIDRAVLEDLAAELTIAQHPGIEDRPKKLDAFTRATAALIAPPLEALAQAYRQACRTPAGREAAQLFLSNLLEAEA